MTDARLGIAGLGLIGGSIGLRARAAGAHVSGFDRDPAAVRSALARGAIDAAADGLEVLAACDTLVLALPVDATLEALERLAGVRGPQLVLDVASVKAPLAAAGAGVPHYVGTHPMAGRERGGIDAADPALFEGATWAYVATASAQRERAVRAFIAEMGATPLAIDARAHDEIVALTSHLPQALSVVLGAELAVAARQDRRVMDLCGPGMMTMLRLARSPQSMWRPIVTANAGPIAGRLRAIAGALTAAADALEAGESRALMSYFASAHDVGVALEERFPPGRRSSTDS